MYTELRWEGGVSARRWMLPHELLYITSHSHTRVNCCEPFSAFFIQMFIIRIACHVCATSKCEPLPRYLATSPPRILLPQMDLTFVKLFTDSYLWWLQNFNSHYWEFSLSVKRKYPQKTFRIVPFVSSQKEQWMI